jgi:predicted RNA binding protein YcfA (HicA-like mRNA interferase family)
MTRLPTLTAQKIIRALKKAGFVLVRQRGSHYQMKHPERLQRTLIPVHGGDIGRGLLKHILKQAWLTEEEFSKLLRK